MIHLKIKIIRPVTSETDGSVIEDQFRKFASPDTSLAVTCLPGCPRSIESRVDMAVAAPYVIRGVEEAQRVPYDACVVNCFADPGVAAAREIANIPVVGPGLASCAIGATLGSRIGIVTVVKELIPVITDAIVSYGLGNKLACVRAVDIPVEELGDKPRLLKVFLAESLQCIKEGAHVIIPGCTGMVGLAKEVRKLLLKQSYDIPVIDPQGAALAMAENLVRLQASHSKLSYSLPSHKINLVGRT